MLPADVRDIVRTALLFHSTVCLAELCQGVAAGDPAHPRWAHTRDLYVRLVDSIPDNRVLHPDDAVWRGAAVLAGTLARTQGFQPHQRNELLLDALILLTTHRHGLPLLTSNVGDFDQLHPGVDLIFYR
jgi:hypothetical protein